MTDLTLTFELIFHRQKRSYLFLFALKDFGFRIFALKVHQPLGVKTAHKYMSDIEGFIANPKKCKTYLSPFTKISNN